MRIAIIQSNYIPWIGYFEFISSVDKFILYEDGQYTKNDWRNRNFLRQNEKINWLSIPVKHQSLKQKFTEVDMDFEKNYISSTIIQILPESRKPAEIKQIKTKQRQLLSSDEVIELIKKLGELHSAGILTDDEFSEKKAELLSKI